MIRNDTIKIKIVATFLVILAMNLIPVNAGMNEYNIRVILEHDLNFQSDNQVNGNGYYATYDQMSINGGHSDSQNPIIYSKLELLKREHGSCNMEKEWTYHVDETRYDLKNIDPVWIYDANDTVYGIKNFSQIIYRNSSINRKDEGYIVYSPQTFAIGTGYYADNPIVSASALGDRAEIKNKASEGSITKQITYANSINDDSNYEVSDVLLNYDNEIFYNDVNVSMNIDDNVTGGIIHLGALEGNIGDKRRRILGASSWKNPNLEIDEVFMGDYHLSADISLPFQSKIVNVKDSWLQCCNGGWDSMLYLEKKSFGESVNGIFDNTCYKMQ